MTRAALAERFIAATSRAPWKTFVLDAHADDPAALLQDAFGRNHVRDTDDVHMHEVVNDLELTVDHLDDRFWSVHTTASGQAATKLLKTVVEARRDLDWVWLPSEHLRDVWPGTHPEWVATDFNDQRLAPVADELADLRLRVKGHAAANVLQLIEDQYSAAVSFSGVAFRVADPELGTVRELVHRDGMFRATGDDFGFHQAIVRRVIQRYRRFVEAVEQRALRWEPLAVGGARLVGGPVVFRFSRPVPDLGLFLSQLFSSREPFRLWGIPEMTSETSAEVEAVDLHVGQQLRFDVTPEWMRVYLFDGGCGNTVARLAANLQHHFDGALSIVDDELDAGLKLSA